MATPQPDPLQVLHLEMRTGFAEVRAGIAELRGENSASIAELRASTAELRTSIAELRGLLITVIDAVADLRRDFTNHWHPDDAE